MALSKLYTRIDFANGTTPALNQTNLNLMSKAIDDIDDRVISLAGSMLESITEINAFYEHPPKIGSNNHWYFWDMTSSAYVDSEISVSL